MNPDEILAQIQELAAQFVAAGGDPADLTAAVENPPGSESAEELAEPGMPAVPELSASDQAIDEMRPETPPGSFDEASSMALDAMKKRKKTPRPY